MKGNSRSRNFRVKVAMVAAALWIVIGTNLFARATVEEGEPCLTIGAIYVGNVDDAGYNRAQQDGMHAMLEALPCAKILEAENVPEGAERP